jgi:hypothetical protein
LICPIETNWCLLLKYEETNRKPNFLFHNDQAC